MAAQLRDRATALQRRAAALNQAADAIDGSAEVPNTAIPLSGKSTSAGKPGRVSKALRPTKGKGKRGANPGPVPGKTRALVEARLAQHPLEDRTKTAEVLGLTMANLAYHLKQIRKAS